MGCHGQCESVCVSVCLAPLGFQENVQVPPTPAPAHGFHPGTFRGTDGPPPAPRHPPTSLPLPEETTVSLALEPVGSGWRTCAPWVSTPQSQAWSHRHHPSFTYQEIEVRRGWEHMWGHRAASEGRPPAPSRVCLWSRRRGPQGTTRTAGLPQTRRGGSAVPRLLPLYPALRGGPGAPGGCHGP